MEHQLPMHIHLQLVLQFVQYGCTDPTALNYDSTATVDDGSCIAIVYGCTDTSATNYYAGANVDDGSCTYGVTCSAPDYELRCYEYYS